MKEKTKKPKAPLICLILGIVSIIFSATPICFITAIAGGIIGLVLIINNRNTPRSVVGFALCVIAMILWLFVFSNIWRNSIESNSGQDSSSNTEAVVSDSAINSESQEPTEEELKEEEEAEKKAKKEAKKKEKAKKEKQEKKFRESCKEYKYKDVLRNPDDYVGEKVKIEVKISSVHNESWMNSEKYYFARSREDSENEYYWGDEYAIIDTRENTEKPKLLEDDVIMVYGTIAEPEETKSLILNSEEVFCIDMKYVDLLAE